MLELSVEREGPGSGHIVMAERREDLTILLVDVSDSTRLYESLGDEAAFREVRGCLELFEQAIAANGGRVAKQVGDGLICVFDEPATAVKAATEMQTGLRDRMADRPRPIGIRVGMHYGSVLLDGDDVYGDTVKVATRMTEFAASGQIILSGDAVARLAPALQSVTRYLDQVEVGGRDDAMPVHEVLWQDSGEYTQLPGRFEAMLAQAGIARMKINHGGRESMVVSSLPMGRHAGNDNVLMDRMASRNHARIERRKDKYVLVDLSSNGTFVAMDGGDLIRLRREEMIMYGSGRITFGHAASEADAEIVGFQVD